MKKGRKGMKEGKKEGKTCRKKETTLGDWEDVKYNEYNQYEWDDDWSDDE